MKDSKRKKHRPCSTIIAFSIGCTQYFFFSGRYRILSGPLVCPRGLEITTASDCHAAGRFLGMRYFFQWGYVNSVRMANPIRADIPCTAADCLCVFSTVWRGTISWGSYPAVKHQSKAVCCNRWTLLITFPIYIWCNKRKLKMWFWLELSLFIGPRSLDRSDLWVEFVTEWATLCETLLMWLRLMKISTQY